MSSVTNRSLKPLLKFTNSRKCILYFTGVSLSRSASSVTSSPISLEQPPAYQTSLCTTAYSLKPILH